MGRTNPLLEKALRALVTAMSPELICKKCRRPEDEVVGTAGDFSLCERCQGSVTSGTGLAVQRKQEGT